MGFDFARFPGLDEAYVDWLVHEGAMDGVLHYEKLWRYYQNGMHELDLTTGGSESSRPYRQDQEYGLPSRITGTQTGFYGGILGGTEAAGVRRKEVVIENDIAWRIDTMMDFLFGQPVVISSRAGEAGRRGEIEAILQGVFGANGGVTFFQQLALLGSIYGFVDVIVRWGVSAAASEEGGEGGAVFAGPGPKTFMAALERAKGIFLEAIEAPRSLPVLEEEDYRQVAYYVQQYWLEHNALSDGEGPVRTADRWGRLVSRRKQSHNVEIIGPHWWQRYRDQRLVAEGENRLGVIPVVHIQNMPLGLRYEGQSDVEPLMPLQDELNTRLSDRASRVTFQSFKMYLGKGIEGFEDRAVAPGRMWSTENPEAAIEEFGGDAGSPSEDAHINHVREALDKASGVASIAAGILKGRIGNLTSAVALKMTLMGVLAKTERKRQTYGRGIAELSRLVLRLLDQAGIYPNRPEEREVEIHWPSPLPENLMEKLEEARLKKDLGVPREQILKELGYAQFAGEAGTMRRESE